MTRGKEMVGMGYALCPVCGNKHDETVLVDTQPTRGPQGIGMTGRLNRENFTGWALCPDDQKKKDEGYVAMVVVRNQDQPTLETADRTGEVIHIRSSAWPRLFNVSVPPKGLAFIDTEAAEKIKQLMAQAQEH